MSEVDGGNLDPVGGVENVGAAGAPTVVTDDGFEEIRGRDGFRRTKDGNKIVGDNGREYVRREALDEERRRSQGYANTLAQLEPIMPEIEETIKRKRDGRAATVARAESGADDDYSKDDLEGYAVAMGFYKGDQPDIERARTSLNITSKIAERKAGKVVKPIADSTSRERAAQLHQMARQGRFLDGEPFADSQTVDAVFASLPEQYRSDPEIAQASVLIAAGIEYLNLRKEGKVGRGGRREPNFREAGGGRFGDSEPDLDTLDRQAAQSRGKSASDWAKLSRGGRPDATGGYILEDI